MKDLSVELILWARRLDQEFKEKIEKERGERANRRHFFGCQTLLRYIFRTFRWRDSRNPSRREEV